MHINAFWCTYVLLHRVPVHYQLQYGCTALRRYDSRGNKWSSRHLSATTTLFRQTGTDRPGRWALYHLSVCLLVSCRPCKKWLEIHELCWANPYMCDTVSSVSASSMIPILQQSTYYAVKSRTDTSSRVRRGGGYSMRSSFSTDIAIVSVSRSAVLFRLWPRLR